jgi:hypothetical protein
VLVLVRLILDDRLGALARATAAIAEVGGNILEMDVVDSDGSTVVDDFVVQLEAVEPELLAQQLASLSGTAVDCIRTTSHAELHQELELISTLAANPRPSLDLLARLMPALIRCDWAVVISSRGSSIAVTHASAHGPRVRWTSLPWLPLSAPMVLDAGESWVPSALHSESVSMAAAPVDGETSVLVCRTVGPEFRMREVGRLGQLARLAGRLMNPGPLPTQNLEANAERTVVG